MNDTYKNNGSNSNCTIRSMWLDYYISIITMHTFPLLLPENLFCNDLTSA